MSPYKDLAIFVGIFVGFFFLWLALGGPERHLSQGGPFLISPTSQYEQRGGLASGEFQFPSIRSADSGSGSARDPLQQQFSRLRNTLARLGQDAEPSAYSRDVSITSVRGDRTDPQAEHIRIRVDRDATAPVRITGWRLQSVRTNARLTIDEGVELFRSNRVQDNAPITLQPGTTAYLITGRSPVGTSFRLNACTGYLEQFQNFSPGLPQRCPTPETEFEQNADVFSFNKECTDYIDRLRSCRMPVQLPTFLPNDCRAFVREHINYTACIENHRDEDDFYKDEWRIYFGRSRDVWNQAREAIMLLDRDGAVVDVAEY